MFKKGEKKKKREEKGLGQRWITQNYPLSHDILSVIAKASIKLINKWQYEIAKYINFLQISY